jgi:phosphatidylinositol alpha-1,6-mannosyltransferase
LPLSFILSRIFNKKLITIAYGLDFLVKYRLSLKTYYFRNADKIIIITNQTKKIIKETHHLKDERLEVIYVGIDLKTLELEDSKEDLRSEFKIPKREFVILSVGRHVPRKNFQLVIKALYEIKELTPTINIHYYLIGEGPETENLKNLTKKLNLEKIITFLGLCDIKTRNKFYKLSDLFIMPSITEKNDIEGFGIVFLEANYYKVPVIGTKTGGIVEAIVDGKTGFLIGQNNLDELVEKILVIYENEDLRKQMGKIGHQRVVNEFLWEKIVQDYKKLFNSVIRNE